jgi:hypothetical protein
MTSSRGEAIMSGEIRPPIGTIVAVATLLAWGADVGLPTTIARAADCLTAPYFSAPEGSHWYYQTDRATQRKCWFLRAKNQSSQQPAEQAASEGESATLTPATEQPATASVGAPTLIRPADSAAPRTRQQGAPAPGAGATNIAGGDDCSTSPNSAAPEGKRWFYRTDRATQRKCWYLRAPGEATQRTDAQAPSAVAPAKKRSSTDNATASAGAPLVTPSPSLKPQSAPMSSAITADLVVQSAPAGNTSPSSRERPAPQTGAQAAAPAPAAGSIDSPAVATANAAERNVAAGGARADSLRPTVDAGARDYAQSPTRGGVSSANATGMAISLTGTLFQMFLVVAVGLGVASLLYRVVTAAARRRKIGSDDSDHLEADRIGNQNPQQQYSVDQDLHRPTISGANDSEDRQPHRSVDERDQFTDDWHRSTMVAASDRKDQQQQRSVDDRDQFIEQLHSSQISGANDRDDQQKDRSFDDHDQFIDGLHRSVISGANNFDARRPQPPDNDWPNSQRRAGGTSPITEDVSKREDTLAQLRRDLDRLLQPNSREDQQRYGSSAEREQFIDDLHRTPISGANDNRSGEDDHDDRRPVNDEWPNNARRTGDVSHLTDEVSERDNRFARLRRDLDWLLQSPKSA